MSRPLDSLPLEILIKICKALCCCADCHPGQDVTVDFTSRKSLARLRQTNRYIREVAEVFEWHCYTPDYGELRCSLPLLYKYPTLAAKIKVISLERIGNDCTEKWDVSAALALAGYDTNSDECDEDDWSYILGDDTTAADRGSRYTLLVLARAGHVTDLTLDLTYNSEIWHRRLPCSLETLERITLCCSDAGTTPYMDDIEGIFFYAWNLTKLKLECLTVMPPQAGLTKVKSLVLNSCSISQRSLERLLLSCDDLEEFQIEVVADQPTDSYGPPDIVVSPGQVIYALEDDQHTLQILEIFYEPESLDFPPGSDDDLMATLTEFTALKRLVVNMESVYNLRDETSVGSRHRRESGFLVNLLPPNIEYLDMRTISGALPSYVIDQYLRLAQDAPYQFPELKELHYASSDNLDTRDMLQTAFHEAGILAYGWVTDPDGGLVAETPPPQLEADLD